MARILLTLVPKPTPAHAHLSTHARRPSQLVQQYHDMLRGAPDLAALLELIAADFHARMELSARAPMSRCRY
jgi:hypothetical protein